MTGLKTIGSFINKKKEILYPSLNSFVALEKILSEFPDILRPPSFDKMTKATLNVSHSIITKGPPVISRPRRLSPEKLEAAKKEFSFMLQRGWIRPSKSAWSSPLQLVPKKNGDWRPCGDYRRLNAITEPEQYSMPHIHDCVQFLKGMKVFSTIDLIGAYHQIPVNEEDIPKTAICTPFGSFEFVCMPFDLKNTAQSFQRFVDEVLRNLPFCKCYIDDIFIASSSTEEHQVHLKSVFQRLSKYGISINSAKCKFGVPRVVFLGHQISAEGVSPNKQKAQAIIEYPERNDMRALKRFLGLINFYNRFIPHIAELQAPLPKAVKLYKKGKRMMLNWSAEMRSSFSKLKENLVEATILNFPDPDTPLSLHTDASDIAMGAVLQQFINETWKPLCFFSRKFSFKESKLSTYDRELLAVYSTVKHFSHWLEGSTFHIITDHKPLTYAFKQKSEKVSPTQRRQLTLIYEFTTDIRHISGVDNVVPDALSRTNVVQSSSSSEDSSDTKVSALSLPIIITLDELAKEQLSDQELQDIIRDVNVTFKMKKIHLADSKQDLYCKCLRTNIRPYVPMSMREKIFNMIHSMSHLSGRVTFKQMAQKFMWPSMKTDVIAWAKSCLKCQTSKVTRHNYNYNYLTPSKFPLTDDRFDQVHIDIVGPLTPSRGFRYLLTIIDRYTRWPEAVPLAGITADEIIRAFFSNWVARFGTPKIITTDRGAQFKSMLFKALTDLIGINKNRTTAYHPQANGLVERWHRSLKASIMCHNNKDWVDVLPVVMLGLRICFKEDLSASAAEFVYGKVLRVPGEFFDTENASIDPKPFVEPLRRFMQKLRPVPTVHHQRNQNTFIFKDLGTCSHVRDFHAICTR